MLQPGAPSAFFKELLLGTLTNMEDTEELRLGYVRIGGQGLLQHRHGSGDWFNNCFHPTIHTVHTLQVYSDSYALPIQSYERRSHTGRVEAALKCF